MILPRDLDLFARRAADCGQVDLAQALRTLATACRKGKLPALLRRLRAAGGRPPRLAPTKRPTGRPPGRPRLRPEPEEKDKCRTNSL